MKVIIVVFLLLLCSIGGASAWYDGFDYRIPITIDNTGNPALEHYQFNVSFPTGVDESSIRVVNDTDYTIVPHWCENETGGRCYELWFNVSVGSEVNTDYYIYYGNGSISSTSDYDSTFTKKYNDSGLVLELHMDEGTGNSVTVDSSGEGNDGTLMNMNTTGNATSGWQGTDGGQWDNRSDVMFSTGDRLWFDGRNDYVDCGADPSLNITDTLTLGLWCRPVVDSVWHVPISKGWAYQFAITPANLFNFYSSDADSDNVNCAASALPYHEKWVFITMTIDPSANPQLIGYVNGVQVGSSYNAAYTGAKIQAYHLLIGDIPTAGRDFNGSIDEVRIYNRTLSEDEIYRQYIRSKYAANTPTIGIGYIEESPHPFLSGAYLFYGEMAEGLTGFRDGVGRYLIWGVVFFAVSLAFALIAKIKTTLIGGK